MSQYRTYNLVGVKVDISDVIANITPSDTPFLSSLGAPEKTTQTTFQWQEDALASVDTNNQKVEGAAASNVALTPTVMRSNVTQILDKTIEISATAEAVKSYGRAKETAYQLAKKSKELKRDLEHMFVGRVQAAVVGDANTARRMASAFSMIAGGTTVDADTDAGAGVTPAALTEAHIIAAHQALYNEGGDGPTLMIKPADSIRIAAFVGTAARTRDIGNAQRIVNAVDVYVSPFGQSNVVLNRLQLASRALLYSPENWKRVVLRDWTKEPLAKVGDAERTYMVGEMSLKHKNFLASAQIINLT